MKNSLKTLSFVILLSFIFTYGLYASNTESEIPIRYISSYKGDPIEIDYNDLPPFVKEFLYKGYEVNPEDVISITKVRPGAFIVKLNRSINVFGITTDLKMHREKLDYFNIAHEIRKEKLATANRIRPRQVKRKLNPNIPTEVTWSAIPLNVQEYLIKRMKASEDEIYKAYKSGSNNYKIILKKSHDTFIIFEDSPQKIAFEHGAIDNL